MFPCTPCSEGVMIFPPNFADNSGEKYEGQWKDGKMAGYGKLRWMHVLKLLCKILLPLPIKRTFHRTVGGDITRNVDITVF